MFEDHRSEFKKFDFLKEAVEVPIGCVESCLQFGERGYGVLVYVEVVEELLDLSEALCGGEAEQICDRF